MTLLVFHLINSFSFFKTNSSPTKCGPGPALSVASGNLLGTCVWGPISDLLNKKLWGGEPSKFALTRLQGDSESHSRTTVQHKGEVSVMWESQRPGRLLGALWPKAKQGRYLINLSRLSPRKGKSWEQSWGWLSVWPLLDTLPAQ